MSWLAAYLFVGLGMGMHAVPPLVFQRRTRAHLLGEPLSWPRAAGAVLVTMSTLLVLWPIQLGYALWRAFRELRPVELLPAHLVDMIEEAAEEGDGDGSEDATGTQARARQQAGLHLEDEDEPAEPDRD